MDIDDSTPEKIEANDQACAREIEAVLEKWGRRITYSCIAKPVKDCLYNIVGWCMAPNFQVVKKPPQTVAVEVNTDAEKKEAANVL